MPLRHLHLADAAALRDQGGLVQRQATDEHNQVGARAHFGQRGGELAAVLQRTQALHQGIAAGRVANRPGGAGERIKRARARHVGAQAGEQRLPARAEQARGRGDRVGQ